MTETLNWIGESNTEKILPDESIAWKKEQISHEAWIEVLKANYIDSLEVVNTEKLSKLFISEEFLNFWNQEISLKEFQEKWNTYLSQIKTNFQELSGSISDPFMALKLSIEKVLWYDTYNKNSSWVPELHILNPWKIQCRSASFNYTLTALSVLEKELFENKKLVLIYSDNHVIPWYIKNWKLVWLEMTAKWYSKIYIDERLKKKLIVVNAEHDIVQSLLWLNWEKYSSVAIMHKWKDTNFRNSEQEENNTITSSYSFDSWNLEPPEWDLPMKNITEENSYDFSWPRNMELHFGDINLSDQSLNYKESMVIPM